MASPLRNPWTVAALAAGAFAFLAWRLAPLVGVGSPRPSPAVAEAEAVAAPVPPPAEAIPSASDSSTMPLAVVRPGDSLGGWDLAEARDPFLRSASSSKPHPVHRAARTAMETRVVSVGRGISLRGLATGSANLVLAQGRVVSEGDTLAGGILRAIRSDRIVVRRPTGDTVFFFPRGNFP